MTSLVKELSIKLVVEETYLLQVIEMLQEPINHGCEMVCDELHIYKFEPVPQKAKLKKTRNRLPSDEMEEKIIEEKSSKIQKEIMIEKMFELTSFKA